MPAGAAPEPVQAVADSLRHFTGIWSLCGGWAVDAWIGRQTREHLDVDVAMFLDDQERIWNELRDWQLVAHDTPDAAHKDRWDGHQLAYPAHLHADADDRKREIQVNERAANDWILSRSPDVRLPATRFALDSHWNVPTMAPEAILFYKGAESQRRPHDEQDFETLRPVLDADQRAWLADALTRIDERHRWLPRLR